MVSIETIRCAFAHNYTHPWRLLQRHRRLVQVRVIVRGHEVDAFELSQPATLRAALGPIYKHLPAAEASVRLRGIEERRWLLGGRRRCRKIELPNPAEALTFLAE